MNREDSNNSIKIDKIFSNSPASTKKKYDGNGSHMSAMSLSIGDMQEEGNLSAVFDSSLRISTSTKNSSDMPGVHVSKEKLKDRSSNNSWDPSTLEMSVGNMSYATMGDNSNFQTSESNMSFTKVFEDPEKNG